MTKQRCPHAENCVVPKSCPRIRKCQVPLTVPYFQYWCITGAWSGCYHYCMWAETLKRPFAHLQSMAVEQAKMKGKIPPTQQT